jgi:hypothetical protein
MGHTKPEAFENCKRDGITYLFGYQHSFGVVVLKQNEEGWCLKQARIERGKEDVSGG